MISDLLAQLAMLRREIPEEEFNVETAVETVVETVDREVTEEERDELESLLPEWLETDEGAEVSA